MFRFEIFMLKIKGGYNFVQNVGKSSEMLYFEPLVYLFPVKITCLFSEIL